MAYQIDGDDEQNRTQVKFLSYDQTGDLGLRSKGQISFNFDYHFNSKISVPIFVCVLTDKGKTHIEQNCHSVARVMP